MDFNSADAAVCVLILVEGSVTHPFRCSRVGAAVAADNKETRVIKFS